MRSLALLVSASGVLSACSDDPSASEPSASMSPAASAGAPMTGSTGGTGPAGTGGFAGSAAGPASGGGSPGSSAEATNVTGPLDPGAGAPGAGAPGGGQPDAGAPAVANAICPAGPFAASPLPAGATPLAVCTGMTFTEGAVWFHEDSTLYFSDFQLGNGAAGFDGRIMTFTPGGECAPLIDGAGTNGLAIGLGGELLAARHLDRTVTIFDRETLEPTVFIADNAGAAFNSPNDIAVRSDGNIYFTDPTYFTDPPGMPGDRPSEQPPRAYRRDPSGALSVIDEGSDPNGITLSPDESRLYVSHLGFNGDQDVIVFDVDASGAVGAAQPFLDVGSDGMGMDCAGNLYITQGGGVQVFAPSGQQLGALNAPNAANVAFGGPERRTLFITGGGVLYAVELDIPGMPY